MWYDTWLEVLKNGIGSVQGHLPSIGAAILLVFVGWGCALLFRGFGRKLTGRLLDQLGASNSSVGSAVESSGVRGTIPGVVGRFVFWLVLLVFLAAAVETLGLPVMTEMISKLAGYAPNILMAVLIVLAGLVAARVVRTAVFQAADAGGVAQARGIATGAEIVVIVLVGVIALEQLGVNGRVLEMTVAMTVGSMLLAIALAFALGARSSVANLIASHYAAKFIRVGQSLVVDGIRGTVIELTPTAVVLRTDEGRAVVPTQRLQDVHAVVLLEEA